jgi:hypothetical protein
MNSDRYIQELQTRFKNNISEKEVYTRALAHYNEVIGDILAAPPIDHVRLENFQYRRQNNLTRLQELTDRENRIVVELLQLRR